LHRANVNVSSTKSTNLGKGTTKAGEPYQLVVTNRAGLYRYVTDHIAIT
jgi:hypothetical protein